MTSVFVCDDHAILRRGLVQILSGTPDIKVVGEAADYAELRRKLEAAQPDVLVIDIEMPGRDGIEAIGLLKRQWPRMAALVLSIHAEDPYAVRALKAGAAGYLNKASAPEQLVEAVRQVAQGRKYLSPAASEALARAVSGEAGEAVPEDLSEREFQVMKMIANGRKLSEIAAALSLSPKTVSVYRARVLAKLGLANNVELAHFAARRGLLNSAP
jgi:DNA-binding NarL/FixJ family response regulator